MFALSLKKAMDLRVTAIFLVELQWSQSWIFNLKNSGWYCSVYKWFPYIIFPSLYSVLTKFVFCVCGSNICYWKYTFLFSLYFLISAQHPINLLLWDDKKYWFWGHYVKGQDHFYFKISRHYLKYLTLTFTKLAQLNCRPVVKVTHMVNCSSAIILLSFTKLAQFICRPVVKVTHRVNCSSVLILLSFTWAKTELICLVLVNISNDYKKKPLKNVLFSTVFLIQICISLFYK